MSLISELSGQAEPCDAAGGCKNWLNDRRENPPVCRGCRFARRFPGDSNFWRPVTKGEKHPDVLRAKAAVKKQRYDEKFAKKANVDRGKQAILKRAAASEKKTEKNFIRATRNSGRSFKDGDQILANRITLDTKHQQRLHPIVQLGEMEKVRQDARRAGNPIGALVIRNANGHGFVVMVEEDFARLVKVMEAL